jgi:formylglycine-generating enzyme required for sulfatase activity
LARASGPPLDALVVALRAAGLGVGVTDSLRVAAVLQAAAREAGGAAGRAIDLAELRDLLRCVVASSREERATFDRVFGAWSDEAQGALERRAPGIATPPAQPEGPRAGPGLGERRRPARSLRWVVGVGAVIGVVGVGVVIALVVQLKSPGEGKGPDAGPIEDAGFVDKGDAGANSDAGAPPASDLSPPPVEPPPAEGTVPTQLALVLASAFAAFFLGRRVLRSSWLPRVLAPPSVPGPPEVPPLPVAEGARGAGLLTAVERDDLAFAVDRFIREEPSPELDAPRSIDASVITGGRAVIVHRPAMEHRTVWLWTDAASSSPLVHRFAEEVAAALASTGLPSERGRFACVPDRIDADERGALEPHELEDAAMGSAVLLVTDGEGLARRLGDAASRGWVRPRLRVLSRWPRVAFVAVADEGRRALSAAFARYDIGVGVLAPDEVQTFLAGQDPRPAPRERRRMVGDTLAWAAGCCLSGRPVDAPTALALRAAMGIAAPVWDLEAVLADVAGASGAGIAAARRRADRLRWLTQVSRAGQGGVAVPEGSLLGRALAFFCKRLADEDAERTRRDGEDPWVGTPVQRELWRRRALLDLWAAPDDALAALHRLYPTEDPSRWTALAGYAAGASRVESRSPGDGELVMPWAMRGLQGASPVLAQDLGLRVIGEGEERWRQGVPGRAILAVGVVLGLSTGAGVGAAARWAQRSKAALTVASAPAPPVASAPAPPVASAPALPKGSIDKSSQCPTREEEDSGLVFVRVCGGTFQMGSSEDDKEADTDEKPAHDVRMSTFWIGKYEVSNAEYRKAMGAHAPEEGGDLPATNVTWNEAQALCASMGHRLPTEAEWEYAARGSEGRKYPWGNEPPSDKLAVFGGRKVAVVKSYSDVGSPYGTVHQAGNAWEWVEDCYDRGNYAKRAGSVTVDPSLIDCPAGGGRVVRGGSFNRDPGFLRSAGRFEFPPVSRLRDFGFRCVRGPRRQP